MLAIAGCRLGNTYPEITEMQTRHHRGSYERKENGDSCTRGDHGAAGGATTRSCVYQKNIIDQTAEKVFSERNDRLEYMVGTMIEVPRAAVTAHQIAEVAEFFSFGTNDLTQMTLRLRATTSASSCRSTSTRAS